MYSGFNKKYFSKSPKGPRLGGCRARLEDKSFQDLIRILDREVSFYVRKIWEISPGLSRCYTCKSIHRTSEIQAGHYISRRYYATRFDLRNIRPQCPGCNGPRGGEPVKFRKYLVEDIGESAVLELESTMELYGEKNLPREDLIEQIKFYRKKNSEIRRRN